MEDQQRTIIIGDIHGCLNEFQQLIRQLDYQPTCDRVILVGDLIDRGPDSAGCVQYAREMNFECVLANHEHKFLKWLNNRGSRRDVYDSKPHYTQFSEADTDYMFKMPLYIQLADDTVICHAGLRPNIPLDRQTKDDLCYIRYLDDTRRFVSLRSINKAGSKEALGARFWTELYEGTYNVVYGHNVHSLTNIRVDICASGKACYGIDTGCCFGGCLTALIWETKEVVQVQAKTAYYQGSYRIR